METKSKITQVQILPEGEHVHPSIVVLLEDGTLWIAPLVTGDTFLQWKMRNVPHDKIG